MSRGGARRAGGPAASTRLSPLAALLLVAAAAGLVATLPDAQRADVPPATASEEPLARTVLACPPGRADAVVRSVSVAGLPETGDRPVEISLEQPGESGRAVTLDRGELVATPVSSSPVVVTGVREAARGLLAVRGEREGSTLAAAGCVAPGPVWWFAGAGGGVDHSSVLFLTNADEGPAVVDVRLHGATGSVDKAGTRGITLAAGASLRLPLAEVAPGSDELTVEVAATRGRVAAHLLDTVRSPDGAGREWLPPAAAPAEEVLMPGVGAGADRVQLLVTNPGDDQALVDLQVLTEDGAFVPLGIEQLSVDPGAVEKVDLTRALEGRAAAVRLRAEVPVTGTVRSSSDGDTGYAAPADPLGGPSGLVLVGDRSEVQVAAGDEPVSLQLLMLDPRGRQLLRRPVTVPPAGLVRVPAPAGAAYAVLLPRSGGGHAAVVHSRPGVAVRPATLLPSTVLRAVVLPWAGQSAS